MMNNKEKIKIQKFISSSRFCSRRQAEKYILMNKVTINNKVANIGDIVDINNDVIKIFDKQLFIKKDYKYIMLYKPIGYITSMNDPCHKKNISLLINDNNERILPVGRLDINSEGLLIMTNDYELINKLTHPKFNINKIYNVYIKIDDNIENIKENINKLKYIKDIDGKTIIKIDINIIKIFEQTILISMTLYQGINRQIRKMCKICNLSILKLKRVSVGKIILDKKLSPYQWRYLIDEEIKYLQSF